MNLFLTYGCMYAGKSTQCITDMKYCNRAYITISHSFDKRYGINSITTHNNARIECVQFADELELMKYIENSDKYIFIDEIQFFNPSLVKFLQSLKTNIYMYGLDRDFRNELFPIMRELLQIVPTTNQRQLKAICESCGNFATLTKLTQKENAINNSVILIGGKDLYASVCANCF